MASTLTFDYATLGKDDRAWLRDRATEVAGHLQSAAAGILAAGRTLCEVKERVGHGRFMAWVEVEFDFHHTTAWRLMCVWRAFSWILHARGIPLSEFEPGALYELARPSVPKAAREYAIEVAANGNGITAAKAREIVAAFRPPTKRQTASYRPARESGPTADPEALVLLASITRRCAVQITREEVDGTEVYTAVATGPGARDLDQSRAQAPTPLELFRRMLGIQQRRRCPRCGEDRDPLAFALSASPRAVGGRNSYCRQCEGKRVKAYSQRKGKR